MRVLICGDRDWNLYMIMYVFIHGLDKLSDSNLVIIEGEAKGADQMAARIASEFLPDENILRFPADWKKYGKGAGPIRNKQMLVEGQPEVIYAFHNDIENSKGTRNMIEQAKKTGVPAYVISKFC